MSNEEKVVIDVCIIMINYLTKKVDLNLSLMN
jgi:hypothetical protein